MPGLFSRAQPRPQLTTPTWTGTYATTQQVNDALAWIQAQTTPWVCYLAFDAPRAAIAFDARYLALPLKRDEVDLDHMLQRALPLTVLPYRRDRLLVERVRKLLRDARTPHATAEDIADALALSTRTLHRQLAREDASLRELKEEARVEIARHALARGRAPIKRVAQAAGFRNEKSFSRAFRNWTGLTPRDFRRQASLTPNASA